MRARAYPTWFAAGALLLYGVFIVLPSVLGIGYSFTDWNSYSNDLHWVGPGQLLQDPVVGTDLPAVHPEHGRLHGRDHHPQDGDRPGRWPSS